MELLNVMSLVKVNDERTAADKAQAVETSEKVRSEAIGAAFLAGKSIDEALLNGDASVERAASSWRTWYELDPATVYPAAIEWLADNAVELVNLSLKPDAELVTAALGGDAAAAFALRCKTFALSNLQGLPHAAWNVAASPKESLSEGDRVLREAALEAARLFVTEVVHQATAKPIGLHWAKDEAWKL